MIDVSGSFVVIAWFYIAGFCTIELITAEEGEPIRFRQCFGTFLQFLLFPVGVLFLQSRFQAVFSQKG